MSHSNSSILRWLNAGVVIAGFIIVYLLIVIILFLGIENNFTVPSETRNNIPIPMHFEQGLLLLSMPVTWQ